MKTYECMDTRATFILSNGEEYNPIFQGQVYCKETKKSYELGYNDQDAMRIWFNTYNNLALQQHPIVNELPALWWLDD